MLIISKVQGEKEAGFHLSKVHLIINSRRTYINSSDDYVCCRIQPTIFVSFIFSFPSFHAGSPIHQSRSNNSPFAKLSRELLHKFISTQRLKLDNRKEKKKLGSAAAKFGYGL